MRLTFATAASNNEIQLAPHDFAKDPPAPCATDQALPAPACGSLCAVPPAAASATDQHKQQTNARNDMGPSTICECQTKNARDFAAPMHTTNKSTCKMCAQKLDNAQKFYTNAVTHTHTHTHTHRSATLVRTENRQQIESAKLAPAWPTRNAFLSKYTFLAVGVLAKFQSNGAWA